MDDWIVHRNKKHRFFKSSKKNENKRSKIGNDCSYFIDQSNCHQMFNRSFVQTFKTDRFFTERMIFQMNFNNDKFYKANNFLMKCDKTIVFTKIAFLLTNKRFFSKEFLKKRSFIFTERSTSLNERL